MKKIILIAITAVAMTSCYTHQYSIGKGAQSGLTVKEKNHYLIYGLAPIKTSNPQEMAKGAKDFDVKTEHTFVDGLLNTITFGIYNPTTTTVTK